MYPPLCHSVTGTGGLARLIWARKKLWNRIGCTQVEVDRVTRVNSEVLAGVWTMILKKEGLLRDIMTTTVRT